MRNRCTLVVLKLRRWQAARRGHRRGHAGARRARSDGLAHAARGVRPPTWCCLPLERLALCASREIGGLWPNKHCGVRAPVAMKVVRRRSFYGTASYPAVGACITPNGPEGLLLRVLKDCSSVCKQRSKRGSNPSGALNTSPPRNHCTFM